MTAKNLNKYDVFEMCYNKYLYVGMGYFCSLESDEVYIDNFMSQPHRYNTEIVILGKLPEFIEETR